MNDWFSCLKDKHMTRLNVGLCIKSASWIRIQWLGLFWHRPGWVLQKYQQLLRAHVPRAGPYLRLSESPRCLCWRWDVTLALASLASRTPETIAVLVLRARRLAARGGFCWRSLSAGTDVWSISHGARGTARSQEDEDAFIKALKSSSA